MLIQVVQTIREHARAIDVCSRYGGDEFTVLLPDTTVKQAYHVARSHVGFLTEWDLCI
ncbi:diguanylate cyclase [Sphaerochaeta halotolerans]|uniref:diguanylate cyclase n=1 Tax=Sphaerochaeta halotolerans TaxID=2293840 RepID=A0A372MJZ1_9SPIR|nr:diguanylate cyclase [Sphaerochaeta halotolerans]